MAEPDIPASLRQISALAECVTQALGYVDDCKSPYVLHQERVAAVKENCAKLWQTVKSQPAGQQDVDAAAEATLRMGGELSELERKHAATVDEEFHIYQTAMDAQFKKLCSALIGIMGRSLVMETLGLQGSDEAPSASKDAELTDIPQPLSPSATDTQPDPEPQQMDEEKVDADPIEVDEPQPNNPQDQPAPVGQLPTKKRSAPSTPSLESPRKRARTERRVSESYERTIEFSDVYQGGKAAIKHIIANYENEWYIIRCDEHELSFKDRPIMAGGKHLSGKIHGHLPRTREFTIATLGIRVLNCNARLAEKNNQASKEAFRRGWEPAKMNLSQLQKAPESPEEQIVADSTNNEPEASPTRQPNTSLRNRKKFEGVTDPTPGDIYRAYWAKDKAWHAVLVLPGVATDQSVDIGLSGSIQDLGLTEQLPACYTYDEDSGTMEWKDDYRDGGARVTEREFPVMYFDGLDFPSQSAVGWVSASNLEVGHVRDKSFRLIPHYQSALRFLNAREKKRLEDEKVEESKPEQEVPQSSTPEHRNVEEEVRPTDQTRDEDSINLPDSRKDSNEPDRQEAPKLPEPPQAATVEPPSNSPEIKASIPEKDPVEQKIPPKPQQLDIISISSNSPSTDSLDFPDEAPPTAIAPSTVTKPLLSKGQEHVAASVEITSSAGKTTTVTALTAKSHQVSVEKVGDESERPRRNQDLAQTALDCLQMNGWYESPKHVTNGVPATTTQPTNASQGVSVDKAHGSVDRMRTTPIPEGLLAVIREGKAEKVPAPLNARNYGYSTSPLLQPQRSLSSSAAPASGPVAHSGRPSSPHRRSSLVLPVPRDLNAGVSTAPTTYQLSSFRSLPPTPTTQQAFPRHPLPHQHFSSPVQHNPVQQNPVQQNPLPSNPPLNVPQNRILGSGQPPVTLPPITIPSMAAGQGGQALMHHQPPFSAPPPHHAPLVQTSRPNTAQSAPSLPASPMMHDQFRFMNPGNATVAELRRVHTCPGCPKRYAQQTWRDKHVQSCHPEFLYNRVS